MTEEVLESYQAFHYSYHQECSCQYWDPQWQVLSSLFEVPDSWWASTGVVVKLEDNTLKKKVGKKLK